MLKKTVTKLWQGQYLSIRTYEAINAIKKGGLKLCYGNDEMILSPDEIKKLQPTGKVIRSKTGGKDYQLIDIKFIPNVADPRQQSFFA
jgi:hypothetical protein